MSTSSANLSSVALRKLGVTRGLLDDGTTYDAILDLANRIGVTVVQGIDDSTMR